MTDKRLKRRVVGVDTSNQIGLPLEQPDSLPPLP